MAFLRPRVPYVVEYWLYPFEIAVAAALLILTGGSKSGTMSLPPAIGMSEEENLWVEIARFKDASHMKDVHATVAKNPHLEKLHSRFDLLITGKHVYHAEFESLQQK